MIAEQEQGAVVEEGNGDVSQGIKEEEEEETEWEDGVSAVSDCLIDPLILLLTT